MRVILLLVVLGVLHGCASEGAVTEVSAVGPTVHPERVLPRAAIPFVRGVDGALTASSRVLAVSEDDMLTVRVLGAGSSISLRTAGAAGAPRLGQGGRTDRDLADGIVEHVELRGDRVEQSWTISARPAGSLVLRVEVRGPEFVSENESGLHFREPGASTGFRYGHGTLIDAAGVRTHVPARWTGTAIALAVPHELLRQATFPVVLDPVVSPEIGLDDPLEVPHSGSTAPRAIFDGREWWVFFYDTGRPSGSLRLTRVSEDGELLDRHGTELVRDAGVTGVAMSATQILVVWSDGTVRGVRIDLATRTVLDAAPIEIHPAIGTPGPPTVATDGTDFYVAYHTYGRDLNGRLVRSDGSLGPPTVLGTDARIFPQVVYSNGRYVVLHTHNLRNLAAYRVQRDGTVLDASGISLVTSATTGGVSTLAATVSEGSILAVWARGNGPSEMLAARIDADGALGMGPIHSLGTSAVRRFDAAIGATAGRAAAGWWETPSGGTPTVFVATMDADGAALTAPFAVDSLPSTRRPALSPGPATMLVLWDRPGQLLGRRLRDDATWIEAEPTTLTYSSNDQMNPVAGFGAGVHLVAWSEQGDLRAARVARGGAPLDRVAIRVTEDGDDRARGIASAGSELLLVWERDGVPTQIYGTRFAPDGTILANDIPIVVGGSDPGSPAVASDGSQYMVAWLDDGVDDGLWVRRFAVDGTPLAPATRVRTDAWGPIRIGFTAGIFGVLYRTAVGTTPRVGMVRVGADGTVRDSSPVFSLPSECGELATGPASFVAFLCWDGRAMQSVAVPAVGRAGTVQTLADTFPRTGDWDGAGFDGTNFIGLGTTPPDTGITGVAVDSAGVLIPGPRFAVMDDRVGVSSGLSVQDDGGMLFVYERNVPEVPFGSERVRARFIGGVGGALGAPCAEDAACASGHCADGVCCDSACGGGDPSDCQACSVSGGAPTDGVCSPLRAATSCRAATGVCDLAETCDGTSTTCPLDVARPDGESCEDGATCNGVEQCSAGLCVAGFMLACDDGDPCTIDSCAEPAGCEHATDTRCGDADVDAFVLPVEDAFVTADAYATADAHLPQDAGRDAGPDALVAPDVGAPVEAPADCGCAATRPRDMGGGGALLGLAALATIRRRRARVRCVRRTPTRPCRS